ncbi:hypothetical protein [Streptomyces sp. NBC_01006]|uniref:hypothetical protein n=1 Tax=Streptomyces sp. NBC_01006 TaxID=2903716 RepID=UPI003869ED0F|nr:hypothetical protein OG509_38495 [Streptomyces sp. NBC_01006]
MFTAASTTQLSTAHVHDLGPEASTITLHDDGLRQGCMTHHVGASVADGGSPLLGHRHRHQRSSLHRPAGQHRRLPYLTAFAESCKLLPPQPPRPAPRKQKTGTAPRPTQQQKAVWPVCTVHYGLAWAMREPDLMRGCPYPPPHTSKTIARRKNGWLPPDYGLRELQPPR